MWQSTIRRQQFMELLQQSGTGQDISVRQVKQGSPLKEGDIQLLWAKRPDVRQLPVAMVVREEEVDEFLAWTNTYLQNWSPITAYFRVLSDKEAYFDECVHDEGASELVEAASFGLVVAEAMGQVGEKYDLDRVSMAACSATFSFAAAQEIRRSGNIGELAERWSFCRRVTGQTPLRLEVGAMLAPWETLGEFVKTARSERGARKQGGNRTWFVKALNEFVNLGEIEANTWRRVTKQFPRAWEAMEPMKGTQEERVAVLESVLAEGANLLPRYREDYSFVAGYLASRIFPGTVKHAGLVLRHVETYPSAVLWLGLFAGLHSRRELTLTSLGRRVWRSLSGEEGYLARPRCDIAIRELKVLVKGGMFEMQCKTETPNRLVVELRPGVNTVVRWPTPDVAREAYRHGDLFGYRAGEVVDIVHSLRDLHRGLSEATRRLERWMHG